MNLKIVFVVESLVFGLFAVATLFLTRFVRFFDVEWELSILVGNAFLPLFVLGLVFVFVRLRLEKDTEEARRTGRNYLVYFPIILLTIVLIGTVAVLSIQSSFDYGRIYRRKLADLYNETDGGTNSYLDTLHTKFLCCGTSSMKLNVTNVTTVFEPVDGVFAQFPSSCCVEPKEHCGSEHIHQLPCDVPHFKRVKIFHWVTVSFLVVSLIWKVFMVFAYQKHSDTLFT